MFFANMRISFTFNLNEGLARIIQAQNLLDVFLAEKELKKEKNSDAKPEDFHITKVMIQSGYHLDQKFCLNEI